MLTADSGEMEKVHCEVEGFRLWNNFDSRSKFKELKNLYKVEFWENNAANVVACGDNEHEHDKPFEQCE